MPSFFHRLIFEKLVAVEEEFDVLLFFLVLFEEPVVTDEELEDEDDFLLADPAERFFFTDCEEINSLLALVAGGSRSISEMLLTDIALPVSKS